MARIFLTIAGISGALSVGLGAFGAHALKDFLTKNDLSDTFETAVRYQFYHTLALLGIALLMQHLDQKLLLWSGWAFVSGMTIFSGSLYLLVFTQVKWLGAITPIGGVGLILGWIFLALAAYKMVG